MSIPFDEGDGRRQLTPAEVRKELADLDMSLNSKVLRAAQFHVDDLSMEGRDLLHDAVCRAIHTKSYKQGVTFERFMSGVMRSIASTRKRSRERREEQELFVPAEEVIAQLGMAAFTVQSPDEMIEAERIQRLCADVLDQLAAVSSQQADLIDGIGLGLRGKALADHVGIRLADLATIRRALKRQVQRIWPEIDTLFDQPGGSAD